MKRDLDDRIFYWLRSTGIEHRALREDVLGRQLRDRCRAIHKSITLLNTTSTSPRMRVKHWKIIHESIGIVIMQAHMHNMLRREEEILKIQEDIMWCADKEFDLNPVS